MTKPTGVLDPQRVTCWECSGNGGYYDRPNGDRYLSNPRDGTQWQRCPECEGSGFVRDDDE